MKSGFNLPYGLRSHEIPLVFAVNLSFVPDELWLSNHLDMPYSASGVKAIC